MENDPPPTLPVPTSPLVDQLLAEQDDVMRQLDELDAKISAVIDSVDRERRRAEPAAA